MLTRIFISCALVVLVLTGQAQVAENITASFKDGKATITYDLNGLRAKEVYIVTIYASYNGFSVPLKLVSGDVGKEVNEGKGKKIEWSASAEAGSQYRNDITFRISVALLFTPLEFINPTGGSIRRGSTTVIEWIGGYLSNEKELELYKGNQRVASLGKMKDVWLYQWEIPKDIEQGNDYTLRLSGKNENLVSNTFRIKRRTPLLVKLSPLIVAAAVIPFLRGSSESNALPGAPTPE